MKNYFVYEDITEDGKEFSLEIHYEYIKGKKAYKLGDPDSWHDAEGPEIMILYVVDAHGNELTDPEWQQLVSEDILLDEIINIHLEEDYEN